jgi:hypothetical protein
VFTARRINRPAITCALACALLVSAMSGAAAARPKHTPVSAALAQERYYSSYSTPETIAASNTAAQAQERYYSSYGEPQLLTAPRPPAATDDTPWLPIALAIAAGLAIAAASATQLRRLGIRRRRAVRART